MMADRQKKWEATINKRRVKNERHLDVNSFGVNNRCIRQILDQGLSFWLEENPGYNKALVTEFYKKMKIPVAGTELSPDAKITSKIGKIPV